MTNLKMTVGAKCTILHVAPSLCPYTPEIPPLHTCRAEHPWLQFTNVPHDALLLLRNKTRGTDIRPFTYEEGKQVWW